MNPLQRLNRWWSGADFWDKDENKRQREQFAREDAQRKAQQAQPKEPQQTIKVAAPQQQPTISIGQPQPQPKVEVKQIDPNRQDIVLPDGRKASEIPAKPKVKRIGFEMDEGKNKTIFGWNAAALLPKKYEKKYGIKVGREFETDDDDFLKQYDKLSDEFRNLYVSKLTEQAEGGNETARSTLDLIRGSGRLKGDFSDFLEGANERFYGGLTRGVARGVDQVLPGVNTFGLERFADDYEQPRQVTDAGRKGETTGTVMKGLTDVGTLVIPTAAVDKVVKGSRLIRTLEDGSKLMRYGSKVIRVIPGSVTGTIIDYTQQAGRGDETNLLESAATGLGIDLAIEALPAVVRPFARKFKGALGKEAAGTTLVAGSKQADEVIPELRTMISEDLKEAPNIDFEQGIKKIKGEELELGADTVGEVDPKRIEEYIESVRKGEPIDPLVVTREGNQVFVQDGKHRLAALQALGIEDVPVIFKSVPASQADNGLRVVNGQTIDVNTGEILDAPQVKARQEAAQKQVQEGIQKQADSVDEAQQPIAAQQEQATQRAGASNIAEDADAQLAAIQARREAWGNADEGTRQEMIRRAQADMGDDLSIENNPWSRQAVYEDLLATGMTPEDIVALTRRYGMTAQDWRAVLNATGDLSNARSVPAVLDSQIRQVTGRTPQAAAQAAAEELPTPSRVEPQGTPDEVVSTYQNNINEIREAAQAALTRIDDFLKNNDSSYEQLARKIQAADRTGVPPQLSDAETRAYTLIRTELDNTLQEAIAAGRASAETGMREWYLPQAKRDATRIPETMEDLYQTGFGYDMARSNAIDLEELDYGFDPLIDYVVKGKAAENITKARIYNDIVASNPNVTREAAEAATETRAKMIDDINKLAQDPKADATKIDTVGALAKEADELGIQRIDDNSRIDRLSINNEDRLKSIGQYNRGFYQYRSADALAQNVTDIAELPAFFREIGLEALPEKRIDDIVARTEYLLENAARYMEDASPEQLANYQRNVIGNAIRSAAKSNVEETIRLTNFTDANTAKFMNQEFNNMAIGFNKAQTTTNQLVSIARRVMNNSMRNLNVNSFLNEMTDVVNAVSRFGSNGMTNLSPRGMYDIVDRYGMGHTINRMDNPDVAVEAFNILGSGNKKAIDKFFKAADTIDRKTALYTLAENYKAAVYLKAAEDFYTANTSLRGIDLTNQVLEDFYRDMLPLDHFSRVFSSDNQVIKLLTQYLDWNILNTRQQFRNLIGQQAGGKYASMSRGGRISRNLAVNLAPRIGIGMVRGVPIVTTLGVLDPAGVLTPDYSGVQDKNPLDTFMQYAGISPILSLATQAYFNYRQDEEAERMYEGEPPEDLRGDWKERTGQNLLTMFTPFGGQIKRTGGMMDVLGKGYSENKTGRVQYLAPENPLDILRGLVMGKGQTMEGRDYSGTPDIFSVLGGDATLTELFTSNPSVESVTRQSDFERPLSDRDYTLGKDAEGNTIQANYSDLVKALVGQGDREGAEEMLSGGRAFNQIMDTFRDENPEAYSLYEETFSGNFVKPEFWRQIIGGNADGSIDLATFKMMGDRKKQLAKDLKAPYDPIYDLPDDNARAILQYKAAATGDDIALQNILYKSQWYKDYVAKRDAYYDNMPEGVQDESGNTERVKQWNALEKQLIGLKAMDSPELQARFPFTSAYKAAQAEFEKNNPNGIFYGSPEAESWFSVYGDGYRAEKDAVDAAELEIINAMRGIEGFPPMTMEQYQQATNVVNTSGGGGGGGRSGGGFDYIPEFYNTFKAQKFDEVKNPVRKFKPNTRVSRGGQRKVPIGARSSGRGA